MWAAHGLPGPGLSEAWPSTARSGPCPGPAPKGLGQARHGPHIIHGPCRPGPGTSGPGLLQAVSGQIYTPTCTPAGTAQIYPLPRFTPLLAPHLNLLLLMGLAVVL